MALSLEDWQVADIAVTRCKDLAGLAGLVQPCVVKNTFLHVASEARPDRRREQSAPPKLAEPAPEGWEACCAQRQVGAAPTGSTDFSAAETDDTGASADEADAVNGAGCDLYSEISWRPYGSRQMSSESSNFSALSGDSEASPTSWAHGWHKTWEARACADTGSTSHGFVQPEAYVQDGTGGSGGATQRQWCPSRVDPMSWEDGVTTVMIRQIPRGLSQRSLMAAINKLGYEGLYDFLYLPCDSQKNVNVGYGFVNFTEPEYAQAFRAELDGTFLDRSIKCKGKPVYVHPAKVQGFEANYRHFSRTKTGQKQDPHFSPLFFRHPELAEMPVAGTPDASCAFPAPPHAAARPRPGRGGTAGMQALFEGQSPHGGARRQPFGAERQAEFSPWPEERGPLCFGEPAGPAQEAAEAWAMDFQQQLYLHGGCPPPAGAAAAEPEASSSSGPASLYHRQLYHF